DQHIVRPSVSVMVICVLLNDAAICTTPCGTTRRSRFFLNSFLRFPAAAAAVFPPAAGFAGAPVSGAAFCSFPTACSVSPCFALVLAERVGLKPALRNLHPRSTGGSLCYLALLADRLLLGCDGAPAWTLAGTSVGVRALATDRKISTVANSTV